MPRVRLGVASGPSPDAARMGRMRLGAERGGSSLSGRSFPAIATVRPQPENRREPAGPHRGTSLSNFQLAFELAQEAPIGSVGEDSLRARLDEADLVHA